MNARREGDENPKSSVAAEIMNLPANRIYGYQNMDRSQPLVTKYLSDEKTHGSINNQTFRRRGYKNDQLYEVELVRSEFQQKESTTVGLFVLQ